MNLASKYRPKTWDDIVEQDLVVTILKNMATSENLPNRNFLLIGPAGVGKTTSAKVLANILNEGKGESIEIDAASHSGVDSIREIVKQAQAYPIGCKYKVYIIDECFTGDVKVLTSEGFKRFDQLDHTEKIAQYTDQGTIEFVDPIRHVVRYHSGEMYKVYPKFGDRFVTMTPGHIQPTFNYKTNTFKSNRIDETEFAEGDRFLLSGSGTGYDEDLTDDDKLAIALAADGHLLKESNDTVSRWQVRLSRLDKISNFQQLLQSNGVLKWSVHKSEDGVSEWGLVTSSRFTKHLDEMFDLNFGYNRANQFIDELMKWDGSRKSGYPCYFSSTYSGDADLVSAIATLAGYSVQQNKHIYKNSSYKDEYQVCMIPCKYNVRFKPRKELIKHYEGNVYCVEVPSHRIIVQADGFTFITGNCHAISNTGWQAFLATLESSPAMSVFIFCTTNPEKIPATILSRVQTFQLSKISLNGIVSRIKHVIECEVAEGNKITYSEDAVLFLAKLANGGMRDALTLLDKALAYSNDLSITNLEKALNLPNYDKYFELLNAYARRDNSALSVIIDEVYNSGINFVKWFEGFHSFVMNVVKFIFLHDISQTMIPSHYQDKISKYGEGHAVVCLRLGNVLIKMINDLKQTQYLQEVALTYLLSERSK